MSNETKLKPCPCREPTGLAQYEGTLLYLLDRGPWKFSWHLPRMPNSSVIDWSHPDTVQTIRDRLAVAKGDIRLLKRLVSEVEAILMIVEARRLEDKGDDDA